MSTVGLLGICDNVSSCLWAAQHNSLMTAVLWAFCFILCLFVQTIFFTRIAFVFHNLLSGSNSKWRRGLNYGSRVCTSPHSKVHFTNSYDLTDFMPNQSLICRPYLSFLLLIFYFMSLSFAFLGEARLGCRVLGNWSNRCLWATSGVGC